MEHRIVSIHFQGLSPSIKALQYGLCPKPYMHNVENRLCMERRGMWGRAVFLLMYDDILQMAEIEWLIA